MHLRPRRSPLRSRTIAVVGTDKCYIDGQRIQGDAKPNTRSCGPHLQLLCRCNPQVGVLTIAPNVLAALERQRVLTDEELRLLGVNNSDSIDGEGEVVVQLQDLLQ